MKKINYLKVEEAIAETLRKMNVDRLLELASLAKGGKKEAKEKPDKMLRVLQTELKNIKKKDKKLYKEMGLAEDELAKMLEDPEHLSKKDQEKIEKIRMQIAKHVLELKKQLPEKDDDESIIKEERKKHINKRYNIRDDWLPL